MRGNSCFLMELLPQLQSIMLGRCAWPHVRSQHGWGTGVCFACWPHVPRDQRAQVGGTTNGDDDTTTNNNTCVPSPPNPPPHTHTLHTHCICTHMRPYLVPLGRQVCLGGHQHRLQGPLLVRPAHECVPMMVRVGGNSCACAGGAFMCVCVCSVYTRTHLHLCVCVHWCVYVCARERCIM